jgi:arylformamidase
MGALAQQRIGPPPHRRGPKVFLDYDQVELDAAYDQTAYAPNRQQIAQRAAANNELVRARLGPPLRLSYGPTEIEQLDLYQTAAGREPIQVFIQGARGGAVRRKALLPAEVLVTQAPITWRRISCGAGRGGSLMVMADRVRRAIAWIYRNAASFGGDPERFISTLRRAPGGVTTDWRRLSPPAD